MKIDRLLGIVITLLQEEKTTAPYLAEKFEVSRRTINRDIEDICKAGIPVVTQRGSGGGISIMDGYRIDKALFSKSELKAIFSGLLCLDSVSNDKRYKNIIEKFSGGGSYVFSQNNIMIDLSSHYKNTLAPKIELINSCIESRSAISFEYYNQSGRQRIILHPYIVAFKWAGWYVFGYSETAHDFRLYKLNRLWGVQRLEANFEITEIPEHKLNFDSYFTNEINAVILFDKKAEYRLIDEYGNESFTEGGDGRLIFKFPFTNEGYLLEWILSFGENAELIEPSRLRSVLKNRLKEALQIYL